MMLYQPSRQVGHGYIRLRLYLGDNGIPDRAQFAAAAGPTAPGGLDRARSIRPLLKPNSRGGRDFESSSGCPTRLALRDRINNPLAKVRRIGARHGKSSCHVES
jgi:hypothetical protein